jgi:hypothetical protein
MTAKNVPQTLPDLGNRFRAAIDAADRSNWGEEFPDFPKGSCSAVSVMFGKYLKDFHCIDSDLVSAYSTDGAHSHTWIECLGLIIDLTGDQFGRPPVFVSSDRQWHDDHWPDLKRSSISEFLCMNDWSYGTPYRDLVIALGHELG